MSNSIDPLSIPLNHENHSIKATEKKTVTTEESQIFNKTAAKKEEGLSETTIKPLAQKNPQHLQDKTSERTVPEDVKTLERASLELQQELEDLNPLEALLESEPMDILARLMKVAYALPELTEDVYSKLKTLKLAKEIPIVTQNLSILGDAASIFAAAHGLYDRVKESKSHSTTNEDLAPFKLNRTITHEEKTAVEEKTIGTALPVLDQIADEDLTPDQKSIKELLSKRQNIFKDRKDLERPKFEVFLENLMNQHKDNFDVFKIALKNEGLVLPEIEIVNDEGKKIPSEITTFEGVKEIKEKLLEQRVEKKITLTSLAKNELRARLEANEKINNKFFAFKVTRAQINLAVTVVTALASIAMTAALIAGVAFPPAILALPGFVGSLAAIGLLVIGLNHLYQNKPNLTKTFFQLVPVRIAFEKACQHFVKLKVAYGKMNEAATMKKIQKLREKQFLTGEDLDIQAASDPKYLEKLNKQIESLIENDARIQKWSKKIDQFQGEIDRLETIITEARQQDFEKQTGFQSFKKDEFSTIAEALITGEFWKDSEAASFVKKFAGVEVSKELGLDESTLQEDTAFLGNKLKGVVLRKSSEIYEWLKTQERERKNGEMESSS